MSLSRLRTAKILLICPRNRDQGWRRVLSGEGATVSVPPDGIDPLELWPSDASHFDAIVVIASPLMDRDRVLVRAQRNALVPCASLAVLQTSDAATARACIECGGEIYVADTLNPTEFLGAVELTVTRTRQWRRVFRSSTAVLSGIRPNSSAPAFSVTGVVEFLCELADISKRERQVLGKVLQGGANQHIADQLGISPRTVKFHIHNLMKKLKARSRNDILRVYFSRLESLQDQAHEGS